MGKELPKNWVEIKLIEILTYQKGKKPTILKEEFFEGSVPYLDIKAFEKDIVLRYADVESSNLIEESSIGIVWDGARSGWVSMGKYGAVGSTIAILKPYNTNSTFLYRYLQSKFDYINTNTRGTGIPHVDPQRLWNLDFPLPPLPEQKRIVAKLDELFAQHEKIKSSLAKIPQILKDFRQAVLTQAVSGKLTDEWRSHHELKKVNIKHLELERERLKQEFAINYKRRKSYSHKVSVKPEIAGDSRGGESLFDIPDSWSWVPLDQVTYNISDGPHFSPKYVGKSEGKRFISMRNISFNKIDFYDCKYVSEADHNEFIKRGKPELGDILYTKGGSTGIPCVVNDEGDFSYWVHVALIKPISKFINSRYLMYALGSNLCYKQSQNLTHGVGNQDLGLTRMIYISFPLPNLDEQTEIVSRVETLFSKADKIETKYKNLKEKIDHLPQTILAKAFKGELVEQLPTDGHAADLLKEIEKLKGASTKMKGKKVKV